MSRRARILTAVICVAALACVAVVTGVQWYEQSTEHAEEPGQGITIPGAGTSPAATGLTDPSTPARYARQHRFITRVAPAGRYFLDQFGQPIMVRGDSPWSLPVNLSPAQADHYFAVRSRQGFNAAIVSFLGATDNGAHTAGGTTYDGLRPFVNGDVTRLNPTYWTRVRDMVRSAATRGITLFAYPVDGWTIGKVFSPASQSQCAAYGTAIASWFAGSPNIVWMTGGDYFPSTNTPARGSDVDHCFDAIRRALSENPARPFSIQLGYDKSASSDNPYWRTRITWNFVYTYHPTYRGVLDARSAAPRLPALLGEANYEGENNQAGPATTDQTLRRQTLWALTSGAAGDFFGTRDWKFDPGWQHRLTSSGARQVTIDRRLITAMDWPHLVPDTTNRFLTAGRGTLLTADLPLDVLNNDAATVARTPYNRQAVVYVPTARTLTLNMNLMVPAVRGTWFDPATGAPKDAGTGPRFTTPGTNAGGGQDWLLIVR